MEYVHKKSGYVLFSKIVYEIIICQFFPFSVSPSDVGHRWAARSRQVPFTGCLRSGQEADRFAVVPSQFTSSDMLNLNMPNLHPEVGVC